MARATFLDERPEQEEVDDVTQQDEAQPVEELAEKPQVEEKAEDPGLPDKYQGKSIEEVVQMHQEAEKLLGRQSSEVGELRKVVDNYIQSQTQLDTQAPQQNVEPVDDIDYFTDPQGAVNQAISNHPKIREAEQFANENRKQAALANLQQRHPDMQEILQDSKFAEWIQASKVRTKLFVEADQGYDHEAADELFTLWKERKQVAQQSLNVEQQARKQAVKSASTGTAKATAEPSRKKVYRRADIIKLMNTDPDRYASLSEEIFKAYSEGRVK
jgi:hypothetical protein